MIKKYPSEFLPKKIKVEWDKVAQGTKIYLIKDTTLKGMNGDPRHLKAGSYIINGFWADICGLGRGHSKGINDFCIQSKELENFLK